MIGKINTVVLIDSSADRYLCVNGVYQSPLIERISDILKGNGINELRFDRPSWKTGFQKPNNQNYIMGAYILIWLVKQLTLKFFKKKVNNKLIVGIGINPVVNFLARIAHITTVEVSHGFCFTKLPWGWDNLSSHYLPRKVIVFDKVSMLAFKQHKHGAGIPRPILAQHPRYEIPHGNSDKTTCSKSVLIALQWGYDGDDKNYSGVLENGIIPCSILELIKEKTDKNFVIRLHPKMVTSEYTKFVQRVEKLFLKCPNTKIDYCTDNDLTDTLLNSSLVVSMYSTISFEAANLGIKSVVMCPSLLDGGRNQGMFDLLYNHDVCRYIHMNDKIELDKAIESHENIEPLPLFFEFPKLENIIQNLLQ